MQQNYTTMSPNSGQPVTLKGNKGILILLAVISLTFAIYISYITGAVSWNKVTDTVFPPLAPESPNANKAPFEYYGTDSVATLVSKALYFRSLLTASQLATLEQAYTPTLARKWSNLPCGSSCRNGIQLGTLTATQLAAALDVIKAAAGTTPNEGYDEFTQIRYADTYLRNNGGGTGYDSTIYFLSFLNTPTTTGAWMIQYGGHHYAANIAYNAGKVVGTTPLFEALEPLSFTLNNVTYAPLKQERDSLSMMLASLTSTQLAAAKLNTTFSDCLLSPGESNGNTNTFPATKQGIRASNLTPAQKNLILAAIRNYTRDVDDFIRCRFTSCLCKRN